MGEMYEWREVKKEHGSSVKDERATTFLASLCGYNHGVAGRVEQVGDGRSVYDHPATPFVASFVGENNGVAGVVEEIAQGMATLNTAIGRLTGRAGAGLIQGALATIFVRPEALGLCPPGATPDLSAEFVSAAFEGNLTLVSL